MIKYLILSLLLILIGSQSITVTLNWNGGHCTVCTGTNGNYACNNGMGNWNLGKNNFAVTVPAGNIVTSLTATTFGEFGCQGPSSTMGFLLNSVLLSTKTFSGQCACGSCDAPGVFTATNSTGFNFNYDSTNVVQLVVLNNAVACINKVVLVLNYAPGLRYGQVPPPICDNGCGSGYCKYDINMDPVCVCPFPNFGTNCECNMPPKLLETSEPPFFTPQNSGFLSKGTLSLAFKNPVNYYNTDITFINSLNNTCTYSKPFEGVIWSKENLLGQCADLYTIQVPWNIVYPNCIFNREIVGNNIVFGGVMQITNTQNLGNLSVTRPIPMIRTLSTSIVFYLQYPISISLQSTTENIFSSVLLQAAVVSNTWNSGYPQMPGTAIIILTTTIQNPFLLKPFLITGPSGMTLSISPFTSNCPDDGITVCTQQWKIENTPDNNLCAITGTYMSNYTVSCQPSRQNNCPIDKNTNSSAIQFSVISGNICPQIADNVDLSGSFSTFEDKALTINKQDFLFGQKIYMKLAVTSTKANIIKTTLTNLKVTLWNGIEIPIYNNGITQTGTTLGLITDLVSKPQENSMEIDVNPVIFNVAQDGEEPIVFSASVTVTFQNTQFLMHIKKVYQNVPSNGKVAPSATASIKGKATVNSGFKLMVSSVIVAMILFFYI